MEAFHSAFHVVLELCKEEDLESLWSFCQPSRGVQRGKEQEGVEGQGDIKTKVRACIGYHRDPQREGDAEDNRGSEESSPSWVCNVVVNIEAVLF